MPVIRLDAGSDTARIGLWDSSFTAMGSKALHWNAAEERAKAGDLFYVQMGGDGGGPLEVYIGEPIPQVTLRRLRTINRRFLLKVPSGRVTVGGVEDFGAEKRIITGEGDDIAVNPGLYAVRCHLPEPMERQERPLIGSPVAIALYRAQRWLAGIGCLGLVVGLVLAAISTLSTIDQLNWALIATGSTIVVSWLSTWILSRTTACKSIAKQVASRVDDDHPIVFELLPHDGAKEVEGGFVNWT